jgi:hypothetical protein
LASPIPSYYFTNQIELVPDLGEQLAAVAHSVVLHLAAINRGIGHVSWPSSNEFVDDQLVTAVEQSGVRWDQHGGEALIE